MEGFQEDLQNTIQERCERLKGLWEELGIDDIGLENRRSTVVKHVTELMDKMINEEIKAKKKILDSLEYHTKQTMKLSKELGVSYDEPDNSLVLVQYERAVRLESKRLVELKEQRMEEARKLKNTDEELCARLGMDPYYLPSTTVPTTTKIEEIKEHIRKLEDTLLNRMRELEQVRDNMLKLYQELDMEPKSEMEMEIVCESLDRFVLSSKNMELAHRLQTDLEDQLKANQKEVMECIEKIDSLYDRLQMDNNEKFQFLANNRGHTMTVINTLKTEISRLEEIKRANIEKFIINIRNELHQLWNDCYYTEEQRNEFLPLHSTNFSEQLLEAHEAEVNRLKEHYEDHKELFAKVNKRQEVWNKFIELERKAKDPSRLMNARGNSLLVEEKERNKVNKLIPKLEQELHQLIREWEAETGKTFLVNGVNFEEFIIKQKEDHIQQLEEEKIAREQAKKRTILQETRFGAKPSTPARLKQSVSGSKTSSIKIGNKTSSIKRTPGSSRILSRINSGLAAMRSPISRRNETPVTSKSNAELRKKGRGSYGISREKRKSLKNSAKNKSKLARGVLSELDNSIVHGGAPANFTLQSVDYKQFNKGNFLNSTKADLDAGSSGRATPSFMNPTASTRSKFKTPTTPKSLSRVQLRTPTSSRKTLPYLI